jgi:glutaredoxin
MKLLDLSKTAACALWLCASLAAQAQTIYRIVGPDGKVTFSDKPPVSVEQGKVAATGTGAAAAASVAALPFELRQAASRYPVTLYSAPDCSACSSGRSLLSSRGIPFSERTITSAEDIAALQRLSGETTLPFLTIGGQRIKGYSDLEWTQYLDAAGYPKASLLPPGYKQSPASALVGLQKPAATKAEETRPEPAAPAGPGPANPAGIQF